MARYGKSASKNVESTMRRRKRGTLRSSSGAKVTSRDQAIAIGLSEARSKGAKVPAPKKRASSSGTSAAKRKTASKGTAKRRTTSTSTRRKTTKKTTARKSTTRSTKKK